MTFVLTFVDFPEWKNVRNTSLPNDTDLLMFKILQTK